MKRFGGFGMVMLLVVLAIVLILVAKQWTAVAPTAAELDPDAAAREGGHALGPGLSEMRDTTSSHADDVQEALAATD